MEPGSLQVEGELSSRLTQRESSADAPDGKRVRQPQHHFETRPGFPIRDVRSQLENPLASRIDRDMVPRFVAWRTFAGSAPSAA